MTAVNQEPSELDERALNAGSAAAQAMADTAPLGIEALALAAAADAGLYEPGVTPIEEALARCVVVDGLTEVVEKMAVEEGKPGSGSVARYTDGFFDADGKRLGTVTGHALVLAMAPRMWQYHSSSTVYEDGTFTTNGVVDATAVLHGITQVFRVTGTGGRYLGKKGYMTLVMGDPTQQPPHYSTAFVMA